jgi:hypothetical protein
MLTNDSANNVFVDSRTAYKLAHSLLKRHETRERDHYDETCENDDPYIKMDREKTFERVEDTLLDLFRHF